jgi:hypothetical protein
LIHLAGLESWAVETGGVAGLRQNNLITVEGIHACFDRLDPGGILSVCRAVQTPPRDNVKLLATLIEALEQTGIDDPAGHVVMVRDFLAVCTMVKTTPWSPSEIDTVRNICRRRELTPVFFDGIRDDELNAPDRLPGPADAPGDWLHHAATSLTSSTPGESRSFVDRWPFDVRPPTDDRPFFENFCKLASVGALKDAFGDLWPTRTELSLVFVLAAICTIAVFGLLLTVVPLLSVREIRASPGRGATSLYFLSIGVGYLMLEITVLSRLIHLVGDPVLAGSTTIAGFLLFSGLGSLTAQRILRPRRSGSGETAPARNATRATRQPMAEKSGITGTRGALWVLVLAAVAVMWILGLTATWAGQFATVWRIAAALLVIGPMGFFMGFPMPMGLRQLDNNAPALVPWAWGINGFASVLAPVLATAIGMTFGFRVAGALAIVFYLTASLIVGRLGGAAKRL